MVVPFPNRRFDALVRAEENLEERLLSIENSRFFRLLRLPGRLLHLWKAGLDQYVSHSPLRRLRLRATAHRYQLWLERERSPAERPLARQPLFSVILPVHNPDRQWLAASVDSVLNQTYNCWELCVCDDASEEPWVAEYFSARAAADPRIRYVRSSTRLGISEASNRAGELAGGEYVGFLGQDGALAPYALYCMAEAVQDRDPDLLYSDEDYIADNGARVQPVFKPAFSPDLLYGCMYMGHFLVCRKAKLDEVGWFRAAFDDSHDYDLVLRVVDNNGHGAAVVHIPRVLYHGRRRARNQSAGLEALRQAVHRKNGGAAVECATLPNTYRVRWPVPAELKASLIVCSRNAKWLRRSLRSIGRHTLHSNREIIVVEHRMGDTGGMAELLSRASCIRIPYVGAFDYAAMNNLGAAQATGDVLVFLNDDVEPLTPHWLSELLAHAWRPEVGVVGARLLYPSGAIQHAGIAIGIMGGTGHPHRGTFGAEYWNWLPFTRNVSAVTGACLAIRKAVFDRLGGFDERFPVNYNDVDLCLRAREAGYEVVTEPAALLRHHECQSRWPWIRLSERLVWEERWAKDLKDDDPFYSPHLTKTREDATLDLESGGDLAPRKAAVTPGPVGQAGSLRRVGNPPVAPVDEVPPGSRAD